ncbi:hypothetical protein B0A49_03709 [Cryomyces minteri]|uniref:DNA polymerase delta subunit 3 n=1 Tax=Cryomyces minteri TaxID=331657 RepID=A0A4U0XI40_9PEZI|nr:hypothetical protein B0A49_03709 [Cryomyces minteri]
MADKYNEYLAVNVLNEDRVVGFPSHSPLAEFRCANDRGVVQVSYRSLSRALKVHSNLAKHMLYDFHHKQTAKKPGSVHATYLIAGTCRPETSIQANEVNGHDAEDSVMQSSPPFRSSSMPQQEESVEEDVAVKLLLLAKEEDLEEAKARFDEITSVHIYSLEPTSLKDLQVLSDCNREIRSKYSSEDPLEAWKQYGTIQNPNVKACNLLILFTIYTDSIIEKIKSQATASSRTTTLAKDEKTSNTKPGDDTKPSRRASGSHTPQAEEAATPSSKKTTVKAPTLKRDKSDIFKSFAKSKAKLITEDSAGSAGASSAPESGEPSAAEDEPMKDVSEDEQEDDFVLVNSKDTEVANRRSKAEKAEREERLRKMMEEEDEPMNDAPSVAGMDDSQEQLLTQKTESQQSAEQEPEATTTVSGGRRRGRRRVMKKKTVKDEEGYLVTKEEPVWESFSEEEPVAKKVKMPTAAATTAKGKKGGGGGKPGQGNIMSFFSKK